MKVNFDATLEDFVDVQKRSMNRGLRIYVTKAIIALISTAMLGGFMYFIFGDRLAAGLGAALGLFVGVFGLIRGQDRNIRAFIKERLKSNGPVPTEVEINDSGLTIRCLGQTVIQEWKLIENIEETDDAIYFRNKYGAYCAARKRGFGSEDEKKEFLDLAKHYWNQATVPEPPNFESQV
ncbi:MAG: YcxB family protein [Acidobacteriota bacterium]